VSTQTLMTRTNCRVSPFVNKIQNFDFRLSPWNEYRYLVLGIFHGVRGKFPDGVSGDAVVSEMSSGNLPRTPCKISKTKNQDSKLIFILYPKGHKARERMYV
jgi:hypothetical protein